MTCVTGRIKPCMHGSCCRHHACAHGRKLYICVHHCTTTATCGFTTLHVKGCDTVAFGHSAHAVLCCGCMLLCICKVQDSKLNMSCGLRRTCTLRFQCPKVSKTAGTLSFCSEIYGGQPLEAMDRLLLAGLYTLEHVLKFTRC